MLLIVRSWPAVAAGRYDSMGTAILRPLSLRAPAERDPERKKRIRECRRSTFKAGSQLWKDEILKNEIFRCCVLSH